MAAPFELTTSWTRGARVGAGGVARVVVLSALVAVMAGSAAAGVLHGNVVGWAGVVGGIAGILGTVKALRSAEGGKSARVRVGDEGVRVDGRLVERRHIAGAFYVPKMGASPAHVHVIDWRGAELVRIHVDREATATRILDALGFSPGQHEATFRAAAPTFTRSGSVRRLGAAIGLASFLVSVPLHLPWLTLLGFLTLVITPLVFSSALLRVGADGLLIEHRLGKRFFPWEEIEGVAPYTSGVLLLTRDGGLQLPLGGLVRALNADQKFTQAALVERVKGALTAYKWGGRTDLAAHLARRGRPRAAWLRSLADREGDFRAAPIDDEALFRVVECPTAEPSARAGAAFVLARGAGDRERRRLQRVAEACVAPRLRVVLEQAAGGADEEALHEALAEVEDAAEAEAR